jgi:hypothetical protein
LRIHGFSIVNILIVSQILLIFKKKLFKIWTLVVGDFEVHQRQKKEKKHTNKQIKEAAFFIRGKGGKVVIN